MAEGRVAVLAAELDSRSALGKDLARIAWRNIFSWGLKMFYTPLQGV